MVQRASRVLLALAAASSGAQAFKFLSNFKAPTIISESQKVKLAKTEERFGDKKLVVITGCSSGLGRETVKNLLATDEYHVVGAVRDAEKMAEVAALDGLDLDRFHILDCELNSFESVRRFCDDLAEYRLEKPIDRLICNAGVYRPALEEASWSLDGHEETMQTNFLSHFLLVSRLLDGMKEAPDPRVLVVGPGAGHGLPTVGGGGVYPGADLKGLDGFRAGFDRPIAMADGYGFGGAKAYKDSKLALAMTTRLLHAKFYKSHGVAFSSVDPGCVADTPLFREEAPWFQQYFPAVMKQMADVAGGYVDVEEAGRRLCQTVTDPKCGRSGVAWSWKGAAALEQGESASDSMHVAEPSDQASDLELSVALFQTASEITGAAWPQAKTFQSPCPTLHVVGAVSANMMAREELKRMAERPGFNEDGTVVQLTKRKKAALLADRVLVQGVLGNTVGRVGKIAGRLMLGRIPETAKNGSFQEEKPSDEAAPVPAVATEEVSAAPVEVSAAPDMDTEPIVEEPSKYIDIINESDESLIGALEDEIFDQVFAAGKAADVDAFEGREWKVAEPEKQKELAKV